MASKGQKFRKYSFEEKIRVIKEAVEEVSDLRPNDPNVDLSVSARESDGSNARSAQGEG